MQVDPDELPDHLLRYRPGNWLNVDEMADPLGPRYLGVQRFRRARAHWFEAHPGIDARRAWRLALDHQQAREVMLHGWRSRVRHTDGCNVPLSDHRSS